MDPKTSQTQVALSTEVSALYKSLLDCWNKRRADDFAALFAEDGNLVGFDGSPINGRTEITSQLGLIFMDHQTAAYVSKIREVRLLTPETALLRAVAGMVPQGGADINPAVNAIQSLVAVKRDGQWKIALFQNTPAAFHGRPELAEQLTKELRELF